MALTLEQYVDSLSTRDLVWPSPPAPIAVKAKPHLQRLPEVRLVACNVYGSLLGIATGSLVFEHPTKLVMDVALDKTVQEFKMWQSMSRKPGQPSEYMYELYKKALDDLRLAASPGEKHPEIVAEKIWDNIVKKLQKKDYKYDAMTLGSFPDLLGKIAYFFHASLQGTAPYPGLTETLEDIGSRGVKLGLLADAQSFTMTQLQRALGDGVHLHEMFPTNLRSLSFEVGGKKPSERLFKHFLAAAAKQGFEPGAILHLGSRIIEDIAPAKKLGMKTALFAGDKESLRATAEQFKDPALRPDLLLTDLAQLPQAFG
jgi:FMN phosphatase YigB (HAD superfamily)